MRKTCLEQVHELARTDERVIFIGSDLGVGTLDAMVEEFPDRFYMEGIAEAAVIGMASGMAMEGLIPYVNTIATFLTRRCFEQAVVDTALHNLPLRLIGNGGGYVYAPLGPTHQAVEDMAIFRAIPNMAIVAVADADEMRRLMPLTLDWPGPLYIRLGKGYDPIVSEEKNGFTIGKAVTMREGDDALLVTTGVSLKPALESASLLEQKGIGVTVLHCHTVKPLDTDSVIKHARGKKVILTIEEGTIVGGLGGSVAETLMEAGVTPSKLFRRVGMDDRFAHNYGSQAQIMSSIGIDAESLTALVEKGVNG